MAFRAVELCAGAGGQALGLESAGFHHAAALEYEPQFVRRCGPIVPRGMSCSGHTAFSRKGFSWCRSSGRRCPVPTVQHRRKATWSSDDRDMFPTALEIIAESQPRAVMLENVPGFASQKFKSYRDRLQKTLAKQGYQTEYRILQAFRFWVCRNSGLVSCLWRSALRMLSTFSWPLQWGKQIASAKFWLDL